MKGARPTGTRRKRCLHALLRKPSSRCSEGTVERFDPPLKKPTEAVFPAWCGLVEEFRGGSGIRRRGGRPVTHPLDAQPHTESTLRYVQGTIDLVPDVRRVPNGDREHDLHPLVVYEGEFIVVGGTAAVLQGAPVHPIDLDIVYALSESNISRLELARTELAAVFRELFAMKEQLNRTNDQAMLVLLRTTLEELQKSRPSRPRLLPPCPRKANHCWPLQRGAP